MVSEAVGEWPQRGRRSSGPSNLSDSGSLYLGFSSRSGCHSHSVYMPFCTAAATSEADTGSAGPPAGRAVMGSSGVVAMEAVAWIGRSRVHFQSTPCDFFCVPCDKAPRGVALVAMDSADLRPVIILTTPLGWMLPPGSVEADGACSRCSCSNRSTLSSMHGSRVARGLTKRVHGTEGIVETSAPTPAE